MIRESRFCYSVLIIGRFILSVISRLAGLAWVQIHKDTFSNYIYLYKNGYFHEPGRRLANLLILLIRGWRQAA